MCDRSREEQELLDQRSRERQKLLAGWRRFSVRLLWEPRDCWVGLYWTLNKDRWLSLFICAVPFFPVQVVVQVSGQLARWIHRIQSSKKGLFR